MNNQEFLQKEDENYLLVSKKLEALSEIIIAKDFKKFWDAVRDLNAYIRTLDFLSKEHKILFKEQINNLCIDAKDAQQKDFEFKETQNKNKALALKKTILDLIKKAMQYDGTHSGIQQANQLLETAGEYLRNAKINPEEERIFMQKEDKDEVWEAWKAAKNKMYEKREDTKLQNFKKAKERILNLVVDFEESDPYQLLEEVKSARAYKSELLLDKSHHDELNELLNKYWDRAITKINLLRNEKQEKHKKWQNDMRAKIDYFEALILKNKEYILRIEEQIEEIKDKLTVTHSTIHQERMEMWMQEKRKKIEDINFSNIEIRSKIEDIKLKIGEEPLPMADTSLNSEEEGENQ